MKGMNRRELEEFAARAGLEPYRGRQIFRWIYQNGAPSFDTMTDLSKQIRTELSKKAAISNLKIIKKLDSTDGSSKFLFGLSDGLQIESVLIPEINRVTLCVSMTTGARFVFPPRRAAPWDAASAPLVKWVLCEISTPAK